MAGFLPFASQSGGQSELSAQRIGGWERKFMKTKTKAKFDREGYQKGEPHLAGEEVDFDEVARTPALTRDQVAGLGLPSPEELAGKEPQTKITLAVDDDALAFYKGEAKRLRTSYQRMMRNLLTSYAREHRRAQGNR